MHKSIGKALLLCINSYSLYHSLLEILNEIALEAVGIDIRSKIPKSYLRMHTQIYRFPYTVRNCWDDFFLNKVNRLLLAEIQKEKPELVLVYNSEFLLPDTCHEIKKIATLVFYMGDSPFYTPVNNYYLTCLSYADLILAPDTFWLKQLNTIGLHDTSFFLPNGNDKSYYIVENEDLISDIPETDIFYTGMGYVNSWGYKKALLMSKFTQFNFRLYGNSMWKRWFRFFPELENHFTESGYIPTPLLNQMFNRAKLIPVDGNPGILNGFHLRVFEALGAGSLPLIEYREDVDKQLFRNCEEKLPLIKDYAKASEIANYYLKNERERKETVTYLSNYIRNEFSKKKNAERLLNWLK